MTDLFMAQYGEDRALAEIFKNRKTGNCIEIGAFDGVTGSNTYYFEKIGWNCLLIEANPLNAEKIRSVRTSPLVVTAVGEEEGEIKFFNAVNVETLSTSSLTEKHKERILHEGGRLEEFTVPCVTMNSLLAKTPMNAIDFVTLDVEGAELSVLKGFDLERHPVRVLIIEDNSDGADDVIPKYLGARGYFCIKRTGCNDWYVRASDAELFSAERHRDILRWRRKQKLRSYVYSAVNALPAPVKTPLKQVKRAVWKSLGWGPE